MRALRMHAALALLVALASLQASRAAGAVPRPELAASLGDVFGVLGDPNEGGVATALALLWPLEREGLAFGLVAFADDLGAEFGPLRDPGDPTVVIGTAELGHRQSYGAAWRLDYRAAPVRGWTRAASATWGFARIADDRSGLRLRAVGSTGFSLAAGIRRPLLKHAAAGPMIRYQRLFNDRAGRYLSAGVEMIWR